MYLFYIRNRCLPRSKYSQPLLHKTNLLMLCKAKVAVCSEIHTKHTYAMWVKCRIFECSTQWNAKQPLRFISLILCYHLGQVRPRVFFFLRFCYLCTTLFAKSLILLSVVHRPKSGRSRLVAEVSSSHAITPTPTHTHTHTHTHIHSRTPGRTALNEWSARRRGRYLHNTQQT